MFYDKSTFFLFLSVLVFAIFSCNQWANYYVLPPKTHQSPNNIISIELNQSQTYEYKTGISGDEEEASTKKQAEYYETSELFRDSTTNWEAVYRYQAKKDYIGQDVFHHV